MAVTFVNATAVGVGSSSSTVAIPSGTEPNDIVFVITAMDQAVPNTPTGYTAGQSGRTGVTVGYMWAYKIMPDPVDTTASGLSSNSRATHAAIVFRNADTTTPLDVTPPSTANGSSGAPNPPSITTATAGAMIVAFGYLDDDEVASAVTAPSGYTLATATETTGSGATVMAAYLLSTAAGTYDPGAFSGTGLDDAWEAATVALRQLTAGGGDEKSKPSLHAIESGVAGDSIASSLHPISGGIAA